VPRESQFRNAIHRRPGYTNRPPLAFRLPLYQEEDDYLPTYPQAIRDPVPAWTPPQDNRVRIQVPWNHLYVRAHADPFAQDLLAAVERLFTLRRPRPSQIVLGVLSLRTALDQDPANAHLNFTLTVRIDGRTHLIPPRDT
jgi:hypothetical protein